MPSCSARPGTKPEYECYDVGHLHNLHHLAEAGLVDFPLHVQFVLGVLGANAATLEQLVHMHRTATGLFGDRFTWSAAGVGYPAEFQLAAASLVMGGHVRVGLEDNLRVERDRRAESNAELVEKALTLARLLDREPATAAEARELLGPPLIRSRTCGAPAMLATLSETFWVLVLAVVVLFAFFVALGAFQPGEVMVLTLSSRPWRCCGSAHAVWDSRHRDPHDPSSVARGASGAGSRASRRRASLYPPGSSSHRLPVLTPEIQAVLDEMNAAPGPPPHEVP